MLVKHPLPSRQDGGGELNCDRNEAPAPPTSKSDSPEPSGPSGLLGSFCAPPLNMTPIDIYIYIYIGIHTHIHIYVLPLSRGQRHRSQEVPHHPRKPIFPQSSLSSNLKAPEFVLPGFQVPPEHHPQRPCSLHQAEAAAFGPLHCMELLQNRHLAVCLFAERFSCTVLSGRATFPAKNDHIPPPLTPSKTTMDPENHWFVKETRHSTMRHGFAATRATGRKVNALPNSWAALSSSTSGS